MSRFTALLLIVLFLHISCQKEPENIEMLATGALIKTTTGECAPVTITGVYAVNTALSTSNFIEVDVDFTTAGDYEIKSDTVNGYYFEGSGVAPAAGLRAVKLFGHGTPLAGGTDVFEIRFDNSTCVLSVVVAFGPANYTFAAVGGLCSGSTPSGTYIMGVPLGATNTVQVQANVNTPGSYLVTTDTVNGVHFTKSGTFTVPGLQMIDLVGNGTPVTFGTFHFMTPASGGCTFEIVFQNPLGNPATLTTTAATGITCTAAVSGGSISNDGGSPITARGICYHTSPGPTTSNPIINSGTGTGAFTANISGLTAGTTYYVRAFATNSAGTAYGNEISFTTSTGCQPKIYVSGWHDVINPSGNIRTPKVWTNTTGSYVEAPLPFTAGMPAEVGGIAVSGTDVYVAGKENSLATLWKNGIKSGLSPAPTPPSFFEGTATSVFVDGTDVYVAGTYANNATVWKNGVPTTVGTSTFASVATSVFVSGTDVYVTGYNYETVGPNTVMIATVWKNGVKTSLSNGAVDAVANGVFVSGSDVYVVGNDGNTAKIWKNGVGTPLSVSGSNRAYANGIFVIGTDVYVAGTEDDGNSINSYAKYWKNGTGTLLTATSGYHNRAYAIYVTGADVYVVGARTTGGANTTAGVWRNGFYGALTSGASDGQAMGIVVKQ